DMYLDGYYGLQIIALFIRSSPNLEKLTVNIMDDSRDEEVPCSRWIEDYSDIRLVHLRIFEITNLSSTNTELNIVKLILMRSTVLKKLRIHIADGYKVEEMHISETLLSAPRASPAVEFIVENEPF
nr:hypothetical protein [Tanacetum cinerariifolium]